MKRKDFRKLRLEVRRTGVGFAGLDHNGEVPIRNLNHLLVDPTWFTKQERMEHIQEVRDARYS